MTPSLNGNWVDLIIVIILVYFGSQAFRLGLWALLIDFAAFLGSFLISLRTYKFASGVLKSNFNLPASFNNALGFVITAVILEFALAYLLSRMISKLPKKVLLGKYKYSGIVNKLLGLIPAMGEAIIIISFLLTSIVALPIRPEIKKAVSESKISAQILKGTSGVEKLINEIFGGALNDTLTYFTVEPKSNETVELKGGIDKLSLDRESETKMFADVNKERTIRGIAALEWSPKIVGVAEAYAMDMWARHYFSHFDPEGRSAADRFQTAGISYEVVGENLALAPTEEAAMTGLMNSAGHRQNILDKEFHKIGIGVVDNGIYGKIFVQEFSN